MIYRILHLFIAPIAKRCYRHIDLKIRSKVKFDFTSRSNHDFAKGYTMADLQRRPAHLRLSSQYERVRNKTSTSTSSTSSFSTTTAKKPVDSDNCEDRGRTPSKECVSNNYSIDNFSQKSQPQHCLQSNNREQDFRSRKKLSRAHQVLLHQAINYNHRTSHEIPRSVSADGMLQKYRKDQPKVLPNQSHLKKNIQMVEQPQRPQFRRWHLYQLNDEINQETETAAATATTNSRKPFIKYSDSVSPLTVLKDEYNIKRPSLNSAHSLSNSLAHTYTVTPVSAQGQDQGHGLDADIDLAHMNGHASMDYTINTPHENLKEDDHPVSGRPSPERPNMYMKMRQLTAETLKSLLGKDETVISPRKDTGVSRLSLSSIRSNSSSNSNADEDLPLTAVLNGETDNKFISMNEMDTQYPVEQIEDIPIKHKLPELQDMMKELTDFKVTISENSSSASLPKMSRTQQKLMDYKQLHEYEGSLSDQNKHRTKELPYKWKIQNETILSQSTCIRLRFSSHEVPGTKKKVENNSGVLGYLVRNKNLGRKQRWNHNNNSSSSSSNNNKPYHYTSNDNYNSGRPMIGAYDDKLKEMWDTEYTSLFSI